MGRKRFNSYWNEKTLRSKGIIGGTGYKPSRLTLKIHPIFEYANFHGLPKTHYNAMKPALQLASGWLTKPPYCNWWVKLNCGSLENVADHHQNSDPCRGPYQLGQVELTMETIKTALDLFEAIGRGGHVGFFKCEYTQNYAETGLGIRDTPAERDARFEAGPTRMAYILLNPAFYEYAEQIARKPKSDAANLIQRYYFLLAATLVHELAHAVWLLRFAIDGPEKEPLYNAGDKQRELGRSWECFMFGAFPESDMVVPRMGLFAVTLEGDESFEKLVCEAIPMKWISEWFQDKTWGQGLKMRMAKNLSELRRVLDPLSGRANHRQLAKESEDEVDGKEEAEDEDEMEGEDEVRSEEEVEVEEETESEDEMEIEDEVEEEDEMETSM